MHRWREERRTPRVITAALLGAVLLATITGCATAPAPITSYSPHAGPLRVVTSVAVWADIAQTIGGPAVKAKAIISRPNQDPHSFEASVRDQLAVNQADLTITNGADYDPFFAKLVSSKPNRHSRMNLVLASYIDQHTPRPNPHLWYDLGYTRDLAGVIGRAEARAMKSPADAAAVLKRTAAFQARIDGLIHLQRKSVRSVVGRGVILTEGFAERMIRNLALFDQAPIEFRNAVEEDQDGSTASMEIMHRLIGEGRVNAVILNQQTQGRQTQQLSQWAAERHVPVLKLSELLPQHQHYLDWMTSNLNRIVEAVK